MTLGAIERGQDVLRRSPLHHALRETALGLLGMLIAQGIGTAVIAIVFDTVFAMDAAGKRQARVPCSEVMGAEAAPLKPLQAGASEADRQGTYGGFVGDDDGGAGE